MDPVRVPAVRRGAGARVVLGLVLLVFACTQRIEPADAGAHTAPCGLAAAGSAEGPVVPDGFPFPAIPQDNPMNAHKVALGRYLFHDVRLSLNQTQSCATCHQQARAFTDGKPRAVGSTGASHRRGAMTLANVAYLGALAWANPELRSLEEQALVPLLGTHPVELGMGGEQQVLLERLGADARYRVLFPRAFPAAQKPITVDNVARALAAFERTLISGQAPYDRFRNGDAAALSPAALRGRGLFNSPRTMCFRCHSGYTLQGPLDLDCKQTVRPAFHNNGLYNLDGQGAYPPADTGLHGVTGLAADMGRFRVPTLRNVAVTAPYMHDGSLETLDGVLDHYVRGGAHSPLQSTLVRELTLDAQQRADLLAFLESLTDDGFLTNAAFGDPWPLPCTLCE